ncbi:MAG: beta-glucosidase, partial [Bacteroidia bacterium]
MNKKVKQILALLALAYFIPTAYLNYIEPVEHWDWDEIDLDDISFPENFIWGVASAAHQVEGGHTSNNWADWENQVDEEGNSRIANGEKCGDACD